MKGNRCTNKIKENKRNYTKPYRIARKDRNRQKSRVGGKEGENYSI